MNKFLIHLLSAVLVLALAAGCAPTQPTPTQPPAPATEPPAPATEPPAPATEPPAPATQAPTQKVFKIGGMAPLTGGPAFLGENMKRLFEYAEKSINDAGGINGVPVQFIVEDDQGSAAGGTTAFKKLTSVDNVDAIIGPLFSSPLLAITPDLNAQKVVALTPTSSRDGIFTENGYVFSIDIRPIRTSTFQCDYWNKKGYKKLAFIGEYNDFTQTKMEQFKSVCPTFGVEVVDMETYQTGATDFRTELTKIKFANPDVIFMNVNQPELVKIVTEMQALGFSDKIAIATDFQAIQEDVFTQIGSYVDGRLSFTTGNPDPNGPTKDMIDRYNTEYLTYFKAKYNEEPTGETPLEWDCINILIEAAKKAKSLSGEDLRAAMAATDYRGIVGNVKFNTDGSVVRDPGMIEYINGQQVYWRP